MEPIEFKEATLLVTHYNRSRSLERLLQTFQDLNVHFGGIVVSDDGSKPEHIRHLEILQKQYRYDLVCTAQNKGLGNNINKGQDAVQTQYTLYIQEDFVPTADMVTALGHALNELQKRPEIDIARFYAYFRYPFLRSIGNGFSEMRFSPWAFGYRKFYMYSDHPHLRRSNFLQKFGRYKEGVKGDTTEYQMMMSFLHNKGKGIFFEKYKTLLSQENDDNEPSTMTRGFLSETNNGVIVLIRHFYRLVKINYDYLATR